ncbi:O-antigen polymerase [Mangrovimonas sp. YM274]|uniref:O-antigen polymerase n=1 Tax=Mangrovimonas sp. YM274 TaxID=3070660 RepID=UPI0027DAE667|nr:O-antigen polymerase [Mangrovimonas sp. YM274]WMI68928.1 O-antigen polymerase [Mangrovimonas sp. YM274]
MVHLISTLFIVEFLSILLIMFYILFKRGVTFKVGISFGVLFFIFIPVWVMIITGTLELSKTDFYYTSLRDVVLKDNISSSFLLIAYIFSIIIYLCFPSRYSNLEVNNEFKPSIKSYLIVYFIGMLIVFIGSGLLEGGNWYRNRHNYFESTGAFAVLISFITSSVRILIISSLFYKWLKNDWKFRKFLFLTVMFTVLDMMFSGNRIYLFCTAILIGLMFLKKYPKKSFIALPFVFPLAFVLGYFASIFRHIRGPLFESGFPTFDIFLKSLDRAMLLEPPNPKLFFIGISESINVNVIYDLFNRYDTILYGATYLKPLFFYVPRSVWPNKPESITTIAANTFGGNSLVTTLIGEMNMNFSLLGIILLPIVIWFTEGFLTKSLRNFNSIVNIVGFIFGILFFRMPFSDDILIFVFLVLILLFFNVFKKYKFKFYYPIK